MILKNLKSFYSRYNSEALSIARSNNGGCYDYAVKIKRMIRNYIETICNNHNWSYNFNSCYNYCYVFIKDTNDNYVYLNFGDFRYADKNLVDRILYRTANNECDYRGGINNYSYIEDLEKNLVLLFSRYGIERKVSNLK